MTFDGPLLPPPVYKSMADAMRKHPQADVMVNFASLRSAYESVVETMQYPQVRDVICHGRQL